MPKETKQIEKPWAVYSFSAYEGRNASGIGKVTNWIDFVIQYSEEQKPGIKWDPSYVKTFHNSSEALDYFFNNAKERNLTKQEARKKFLDNFPNERVNLEKLLAQTPPNAQD